MIRKTYILGLELVTGSTSIVVLFACCVSMGCKVAHIDYLLDI